MAIEKRMGKDGKAAYRVRIAAKHPLSGKRQNVTVGTFASRREAKQKEREALTEQDRGTFVDPSKVTVSEVLASWLNTKQGHVSDNTLVEYGIAVRKHIVPAMGQTRVQRLTPTVVQEQYNAWRDGGMSARYISRIHVVLSQALDYAVHLRVIASNPAAGTTRPTVRKKSQRVWTPDQLRQFLAVAEHDSRSPLWHLLGLEAMRRGEALGLRWSDINWERGTAHVSQTVVADQAKGGSARIQPRTKTDTGARTVRLTDETLALLRGHRDRQRCVRQAAGETWQDHGLIVTSSIGTPVNPANVRRSFDRLIKTAGVPQLTVHELRHTAASLLFHRGIPVKMISERLGHASVSITLDVYSHLLPDMQDAAALAMSQILAGGAESSGNE